MDDKYKGKYRIPSARMQHWDYRWAGAYFITICTGRRKPYFGMIHNGRMNLSQTGVMADIFWWEIQKHARHLYLGSFVVMPNHVHGILVLHPDAPPTVTDHAPTDTPRPTIGQQRFQNQGKNSVSSIIGGYKAEVTKHARRLGFEFAWQPRFYDNLIRNQQSYDNIDRYIQNNPLNWKKDMFFGV